MKKQRIKFICKGRLLDQQQKELIGGGCAKPCGSQNVEVYFVTCAILHGSCSPKFNFCYGDAPSQKLTCENYSGKYECGPVESVWQSGCTFYKP